MEQQELINEILRNSQEPGIGDLLIFIFFPVAMALTVIVMIALAAVRANDTNTDIPFLHGWLYTCLLVAPFGIWGYIFGLVGVGIWYVFDASLGGLWTIWTTIAGIVSWIAGLSIDIEKRKKR